MLYLILKWFELNCPWQVNKIKCILFCILAENINFNQFYLIKITTSWIKVKHNIISYILLLMEKLIYDDISVLNYVDTLNHQKL